MKIINIWTFPKTLTNVLVWNALKLEKNKSDTWHLQHFDVIHIIKLIFLSYTFFWECFVGVWRTEGHRQCNDTFMFSMHGSSNFLLLGKNILIPILTLCLKSSTLLMPYLNWLILHKTLANVWKTFNCIVMSILL